jgi:hypothetical protein
MTHLGQANSPPAFSRKWTRRGVLPSILPPDHRP